MMAPRPSRSSNPMFEIAAPADWTVPAIFNSPHSGRAYPQPFLAASKLDPLSLRKSEDCYVDELFDCVTELGAPLLKAHFPRAFLDVNREPYELDPRMFIEDLPGYANTSSIRVAGGLGTIPRLVSEGDEIYRCRLSLSEALERIETLYRPYHGALACLIGRAHDGFGMALLVDCHSMPSSSTLAPGPGKGCDIVLGDRHGAACGEEIASLAQEALRARGLKVARNKPYAGGFITQNYGAPAAGTHALQIEINRALYMNEKTLEKALGFAALSRLLKDALAVLLGDLPSLMAPVRHAAE